MAPQTAFTIREATYVDVSAMAEVAAAGFLEEDFFGNFMHPHRKEFPEDWNYFWQKEIRTHMMKASSRNYVCVECATSRIVAICLVNRLRDGASKDTDAETLDDLPLNFWDETTWVDRSADTVAQEKFSRNWNDIAHHFSGRRKECWLINFFCVHPDFQRQGIGRLLLQQAVDLGMNEDPQVPVGVISSVVGDQFYTKFGFEEVGMASVGDLSHLQGGKY
jgi:GNAT superfamily N-acetyltransferase